MRMKMEIIKYENDDYEIEVVIKEDGITSTELQCKLFELLTGIGYRLHAETWNKVDYAMDDLAFEDITTCEDEE
jgi:hypothetical protein